jgi:hypothetical protein
MNDECCELPFADDRWGREEGARSKRERIKCAAVRLRSGEVVEGFTHREIRGMIYQSNGGVRVKGTDGFVTERGRFVSRRAAASIALASGQVTEIADPRTGLTSSEL